MTIQEDIERAKKREDRRNELTELLINLNIRKVKNKTIADILGFNDKGRVGRIKK